MSMNMAISFMNSLLIALARLILQLLTKPKTVTLKSLAATGNQQEKWPLLPHWPLYQQLL
jgi:hypothetical protein